MTLRLRLLLTGLATAIPLSLGYFLIDTQRRIANKEEELRLSLELEAGNGLRERCEASPPRTGSPGRAGSPDFRRNDRAQRKRRNPGASGAFEYFAYDIDGKSSSADAPLLSADDLAVGRAGTWWSDVVNGPSVVVPLGETGPCAFVLARIPPRPRERRDQLGALALVVVAVLVASLAAGGPLIQRLRRLEASIRRAASSEYAEPIAAEGHDEVASVAAAFNEAGRQVRAHLLDAQAREAALRSYVANTTHDIATPLTVLQGHLATLERNLGPAAPDHAVVQAAVQEAHYMSSLLRNLAMTAKLEAADDAIARIDLDLSALVSRVVARMQTIARVQHVSLEFAVPVPPLVVASDPTLLEQALGNLVDNAVRYNHPGGRVAVLLDREGTGGGFRLSVIDDGPGVPAGELSLLTTRWFRGSEARTRRPDGKGLGLAIAAEAVTRLGMTLSFTSPSEGDHGLRADIVAPSPPRSGTSAGADHRGRV